MTEVEKLAAYVVKSDYDSISRSAREQLKIRILDGLGCAIGALQGEPIQLIRNQIDDFGGTVLGQCALIGGGRTAPDRAAFYNSALVRYLDFNDSYLAKGETCHPSDNLGAILAASEYASCTGRDLLTALAIAYQVQCRLSDVAPVRAKGFDHTTQGAYAVAAGVAKALHLDEKRTANAIAISGTAFNALRVTRTGTISNWKGLAYPNTAFGATHAAFLAMRGITGPLEVFEGNKGFKDAIAGKFEIDWSQENLEKVTETILKKYNAEVHSQSAIEGILDLKRNNGFIAFDIKKVELEIFDVAYHIIGGGEEGDKTIVRSKEEADHSLQYMIAVAILDNQVMPEQYQIDRILKSDVQSLLRKISVRPKTEYSQQFPAAMPCRITVILNNERKLVVDKHDYEGFRTRPMQWETVVNKFEGLSMPFTNTELRSKIVDIIANLESKPVTELTALLEKVKSGLNKLN